MADRQLITQLKLRFFAELVAGGVPTRCRELQIQSADHRDGILSVAAERNLRLRQSLAATEGSMAAAAAHFAIHGTIRHRRSLSAV